MNALKSLGKLVWGSGGGPETVKLASGVLYELRPGAKVERRCVFKDAELAIRKTSAAHQYQLVAVRVLEEGEDELEEEDDLDDERAFLIGVELRFAATAFEGACGFRWKAQDGAAEYEYIADAETVDKPSRDAFALAVGRCAWARKSRRPYTEAPDDEVQRILCQAEDEELERLLENVQIDDAELEQIAASAPAAERKEPPAAAAAGQSSLRLPPEPSAMADGEITTSVLGGLYLFDPRSGEFAPVAEEVALSVVKVERFTYWINVASNDRSYVSQRIEPDMNAVFNHDHRSLIWNHFSGSQAYSFSVVAMDDTHYETLHQGMTRAAYETLNQEPWEKVSAASQDYLLDAYEDDVEMLPRPDSWDDDDDDDDDDDGEQPLRPADAKTEDDEDESESESESESEEDEEDEEDEDESDEDEGEEDKIDQIFLKKPAPRGVKTGRDDAEDDSSSEYEPGSESGDYTEESEPDNSDREDGGDFKEPAAVNSKLAVGYKHGRSFVVRGSRIGVFKHTDSDDIVFDTTINKIDDTHGKEFTPSSVLLHEQDSSLVLMNQQRPNELYRMDLEYGKVVEEWKVHEDIPTVSIAPSTKYGQMTSDKTLVGISHNMLYRIDPRLGGDSMVVQNEHQSYATKSHFTTAATTEGGAIAVGSAKGEIRLFDRLGVRAKTALPALGDAVIGIDVTSDGRYIVATCKTYLLLIDTKLPEDPAGRTGFQKPFPQAQKPAPKRLQLRPEHVVYMGGPISFTPAKFNQAPDGSGSENTIVTSTGPFVVTWNLRRVLGTGRGDAYHIKQYADTVVADNFRFGQDRSIVVTLPNDVQSVKRSQLAKPTRESLMVRPPGGPLAGGGGA
ncbi:Vacuolar import and degradation protein 27 [Coemansia javaensis]|uniref:Vacuolar import and degradation protein 27 n=1 Tax=Coemansia javaensis TaxID=2761396 RepID=A0A9W8H7B5_9FUNG|nr:Vacuolar import and degradation protein 27 [Coemansia javaensis]